MTASTELQDGYKPYVSLTFTLLAANDSAFANNVDQDQSDHSMHYLSFSQ